MSYCFEVKNKQFTEVVFNTHSVSCDTCFFSYLNIEPLQIQQRVTVVLWSTSVLVHAYSGVHVCLIEVLSFYICSCTYYYSTSEAMNTTYSTQLRCLLLQTHTCWCLSNTQSHLNFFFDFFFFVIAVNKLMGFYLRKKQQIKYFYAPQPIDIKLLKIQ